MGNSNVIDTKHKAVPFDDDDEHNVICETCCRLGKLVTVPGPRGPETIQLWYIGTGAGQWVAYSASHVCVGNDKWLADTSVTLNPPWWKAGQSIDTPKPYRSSFGATSASVATSSSAHPQSRSPTHSTPRGRRFLKAVR